MTTNQPQMPPLNAPPTIRDLNEQQTPILSLGENLVENTSNINRTLSLPENYTIQFELKNISRQVSKIAQKQKYLSQRPQLTSCGPSINSSFSVKQLGNDLTNLLNKNMNTSQLGKYNYYGHEYRFQRQKPESNVENTLQSRERNQNEEHNLYSPTKMSKNKIQELNIPDSQSYFIYFDEPKNKINLTQSQDLSNQPNQLIQKKSDLFRNRIYFSQQLDDCQKYSSKPNNISYPEDSDQARTPPVHVFSKKQPQSKWVLEKKVKKLEKELVQLKKKQNQRQKLKNFSYNHHKKDEKVYVGRQVDQLINSLWP